MKKYYKIISGEQGIQGSPEWLELRKNSISATDVSKILGINPFCSAYKCWQQKMGLVEPEPENSKMREGSRLELEARDYFNEIRKDDFKPVVIQSVFNEWQIASLDGMNDRGEILEIKCGVKSHEDAKNKIIAPYYYSQLQHQIFCSGENHVWYLSYRSPEDNIFWRVERDNDFIEKMIVAEKEFFQNLLNLTPPELTEEDYITRDDNDKEWRMISEVYKETESQLKLLEGKKEALKNQLVLLSNGVPTKGNGITVSKCVRRGNVNYKNIPQIQDLNLDEYRSKPIEYWRVS